MRCWSQVLWTVTGFYWKRFWGLDNTITKLAMVCVAAVALGSSTYAWFINNTKVTAESAELTAKTSYALLISKDETGVKTRAAVG